MKTMLRWYENGYLYKNEDLKKAIEELRSGVENRDKERVMNAVNRLPEVFFDSKIRRIMANFRKSKRKKTLEKYFRIFERYLNNILDDFLVEFAVKMQYHIRDGKLYVMTHNEFVIAYSKEYIVAEDEFNSFISGRPIDYIELKDSILFVDMKLKLRVRFYLRHGESSLEKYFDSIFKTTKKLLKSYIF